MKTKTPFLNFIIPVVAVSLHLTVAPGAIAANSNDIDGDGHSDLIFQNSAGQLATWLLDGSGNAVDFSSGQGLKPGSKLLYSGGLGDWKVKGTADCNHDGFDDLVFQNAAGQIAVWFLDGSGDAVDVSSGKGLKPGSKLLYSAGLGDWKIRGVRDINGDGIADLVFQNAAGQIAAWFLDGTGNAVRFGSGQGLKPGSKMLYSGGLGDWKVKGVRDIDGDGINDLVFQNSAGQIAAWFLDGSGDAVDFSSGRGVKPGSKLLTSAGLGDWKITGVEDVNGDGTADFIFQNLSGQLATWFLDGTGNALDFSSGKGMKPGSKILYSVGLGDWRAKGSDESSRNNPSGDDINHDIGGNGEIELENALTRTSSAPQGSTAKVALSVQGSAVELEVEVDDVPVGNYDVSVGGVVRGVISVVAAGGGTKGRLKFEASPDQAGEALLNFAASGQAVQISKSGVVFFTGTTPASP